MILLTRRALMIFLCLMAVGGGTGKALAHRRCGLTAPRPAPPPLAQPTLKVEQTAESLSLQPESYWSRLLAQEQAKEFPEARKTGLALVNLFPQASQRGAALLKLGEMAKAQGKPADALELFGFVPFLNPGASEAAQARLAASALEFARDLKQSNPIQSMQRFLKKISGMEVGPQPGILREALGSGWQALTHQIRTTSPLPLPLLEELLVLWDRQPPTIRPPEGAQLLADILKKNGLLEEAQALQAQAWENGRQDRQLLAKLPSFTDSLNQMLLGEELHSWLPPWQVRFNSMAAPGEALLNWLLPHRAQAAWLAGPAPAMEQALLYSPPSQPMTDRFPAMADFPVGKDPNPFNQDRLGLSHLQDGQPEAAQTAFQELAQHHDPFWQRLGQVRLADLELSRLQAEPAP